MNQEKASRVMSKNVRTDWMLYVSAVLTWTVVSYLTLTNMAVGDRLVMTSIGLLSFIVLFIVNITYLGLNKYHRQIKWGIGAQIVLVWSLTYLAGFDLPPILFVLIATQLAGVFEKKRAVFILLVMNLGFYFLIQAQTDRGFFTVLIYSLLQMFAYSAMEIMIRAEKNREQLAQINQELLATRFMLKESSQRKERLRISRDLHDAIGHQLTALSLNLEVSCHKVPDEYKPMLKENLMQAKNLLSDVRQVVREMRSEEQLDLVERLQELVAQLPNCSLQVKNEPQIKSLALKHQLMFCLQEGVSNALRHGKASQLTLDCCQQGEYTLLTLTDNGKGNNTPSIGSGLSGMKERLAEFNGEVELNCAEIGCSLQIRVEDSYD